MARFEQLSGRKRRPANHTADVPGQRLLVPDAVHDGGDGTVRERVRRCGDRRLCVHRLRRHDAEVARWQGGRIARRVQAGRDLSGSRKLQPVGVDRIDMGLVEVERPHLDVVEGGEVGGEQ